MAALVASPHAKLFTKQLTLLYGSETGKAEDVAYSLYKLCCARLALTSVTIHSLDTYDVTQLPSEEVVVFVVSTTGDGEVPHTMSTFWKYILQRSLPASSLQSVKVAVFGLGDSAYEKYNACARRLSARLRQLGAQELVPIGLGDDQARYGYVGALASWKASLFAALGEAADAPPLASAVAAGADEYSLVIIESPVDECLDEAPAVRLAVEEYTTLFNDAVMHRPHVVNSALKRQASRGERAEVPGAACGTGAFVSPDAARCATPHPLIARVVGNERITAEEWPQEVRHVSLDFSCSLDWLKDRAAAEDRAVRWPLFRGGDVACVHPKNPPSLVERMLRLVPHAGSDPLLGGCHKPGEPLAPHSFLSIKRRTGAGALAGPAQSRQSEQQRRSRLGSFSCTALQLMTWHLDLAGMPRRSFFEGLSAFATKAEERDKLLELASGEGAELYYEYCQRERRCYVEVLEEFPSARPALHKLLELIPVLQPRHYSVASSGYNASNMALVQLCVAVTTATTPYGRKRRGLCSSYLAHTVPGEEVLFWLRSGTFSNPGAQTPLLLVGPGTGVAPMRAILQERRFFASCHGLVTGLARSEASASSDVPGALLFFGCRKRQFDFLYGKEWEQLQSGAAAAEDAEYFRDAHSPGREAVCVAFSQDNAEGAAKTYVTHKIRRHGAVVAGVIEAGGHVYVAGSATSMPADVRKAIVECLALHARGGPLSPEEAERRVRGMEKAGRYLVEAWTA
jgi:sulfite reductase alpha subunit-like flavoprotein